jgi:MarR family transcriptional regulator, organic hydroperoxide resistance regulator
MTKAMMKTGPRADVPRRPRSIDGMISMLERIDDLKTYFFGTSPAFAIERAFFRLHIALLREFKKRGYDITPEQWAVLSRLREEEGLSQRALADRTFKDKPAITRVLDMMEKKNLIARRACEQDKRAYRIYLTKKGQAVVDELHAYVKKVDGRAFRGLGRGEIDALRETLLKIYSNLE